jgi:acyl-CoA reductase-like NAD-dependent aldehyde dehydrogenase
MSEYLEDFILAHPSADVDALAAACIRGSYEYQGQKCSASSRLYVPHSMWPALEERLIELTESVVVGDPTEPETFVGAVINERQHARHTRALARARAEGLVVVGGGNLYINDKPTGSVVGQQPFGGARASGTNDKAGTVWNLIRFASPRATKRNHLPALDYRYPHLER